jgi:hypothetical protein
MLSRKDFIDLLTETMLSHYKLKRDISIEEYMETAGGGNISPGTDVAAWMINDVVSVIMHHSELSPAVTKINLPVFASLGIPCEGYKDLKEEDMELVYIIFKKARPALKLYYKYSYLGYLDIIGNALYESYLQESTTMITHEQLYYMLRDGVRVIITETGKMSYPEMLVGEEYFENYKNGTIDDEDLGIALIRVPYEDGFVITMEDEIMYDKGKIIVKYPFGDSDLEPFSFVPLKINLFSPPI